MKTGVLLWGFSDLDLIATIIKDLNNSGSIKDFYVQIELQQKTISLLNIFPEEILRTRYDDLSFLHNWLTRNEKKNIIIVIDMWRFFLLSNFSSVLPKFEKILKEKFYFIFHCPRVYYNHTQKNFNKKLFSIYEKTKDYSNSTRLFHEFSLNNTSSLFLLQSAPCVSFLNFFSGQDSFAYKKASSLVFAPNLLKNYPASFLSVNSFSQGISARIIEIAKQKNQEIKFYSLLKTDYYNNFYKKYPELTNSRDWAFPVSLERFYNKMPKEYSRFFLWLVYLGILEYMSDSSA